MFSVYLVSNSYCGDLKIKEKTAQQINIPTTSL